MGIFKELVSESATQIDEAFNQPPYDFTMGKKGATDIFFTFQEDEDGKEFRIQFYGSAGMGKNVRRVFIGEKVSGNTYKNIIKKFKNPLRVVTTLVAATEEFLITPVGMKVDGFAVFIPAVAGARIDDFLKLLFKRNAKLRSKLELLDTKFQFEERGYYLWAVRKGKNPAEVFNGEKVAGMFPDEKPVADTDPVVAPAPTPTGAALQLTPAHKALIRKLRSNGYVTADTEEMQGMMVDLHNAGHITIKSTDVQPDFMSFTGDANTSPVAGQTPMSLQDLLSRKPSVAAGKMASYGKWMVTDRTMLSGAVGFELENKEILFKQVGSRVVRSGALASAMDVISFISTSTPSSHQGPDFEAALADFAERVVSALGLSRAVAPAPTAVSKWSVKDGQMGLKNGKAYFSMQTDGSMKFQEAGAMRGISSSFIESKADILDFMNSVIPKRLKDADFAAAAEKFADMLAARHGYSTTAPVKNFSHQFDGNIETFQRVLNELVTSGRTVEEALGDAAVAGWTHKALSEAIFDRIANVPGVSFVEKNGHYLFGDIIFVEISKDNFFKVGLESREVEYSGMYQDSLKRKANILQIWDALQAYMQQLSRDISIAEIAADKILPHGYREGVFRFKVRFHSGSPARLYVLPISDEAKEIFGDREYKTIWYASDVGTYAQSRLEEYQEMTYTGSAEAFAAFIEKVRQEPYINTVDAKEIEDGVVYARAGVYEIEIDETDDAGEFDVNIERNGKSIARATGDEKGMLKLLRYHLGYLAPETSGTGSAATGVSTPQPKGDRPANADMTTLFSKAVVAIEALSFVTQSDYEQFDKGAVTMLTSYEDTYIEVIERGEKVMVQVLNEDDSLYTIRGSDPRLLAQELEEWVAQAFGR